MKSMEVIVIDVFPDIAVRASHLIYFYAFINFTENEVRKKSKQSVVIVQDLCYYL